MDGLLRAINDDETIRVIAATTSEAVREACRRQHAEGLAAVAIARGLTCGVLLATLAKQDKERVRIQFAGNGPAGNLLVDAHGDGRVRACLEHAEADSPSVELDAGAPRPRTARLIGASGSLVVTRDVGLAHGYRGAVEIVSGEIDEDLQNYLDRSEQLPSALRCEVVLDNRGEVVRVAGVLAQSFPGSPSELIAEVRDRLAPGHGQLASLLATRERSLDELVGFVLGGETFTRMLEYPVTFHCPCGPARALAVLSTLGSADLEALANEQETTEVRCNFCGKVTRLSAAEVRELARSMPQT